MHCFRKSLLALLIISGLGLAVEKADAQVYRQRYSSWTYYPQKQYYYRKYYYKPTVTVKTYQYHYCIYYPPRQYPQRRNYVYFYNPVRKTYWGRYDLEKKGYSMLAEKDRKGKLEDIDESAFPKPGPMPKIPGAKDDVKMDPLNPKDLPTVEDGDLPE